MPRNVEIKARVGQSEEEFEQVKAKAKWLSDTPEVLIGQRDTFYNIPVDKKGGRLKLRELQGEPSQLIYYERPDMEGPKLSDFSVARVGEVEEMRTVLKQALGEKGCVKKQRWLYMVGQTRVHLDKVDGLGHFLELEVQLKEDQSVEEGEIIANNLMAQLGITKENLLSGAYVDLILGKQQ